MKTKKTGLQNYLKKIGAMETTIKEMPDKISNGISDYGVKIAKAVIPFKSFQIKKEDSKNGISYIIAQDTSENPHIAFVEFGTGKEGERTVSQPVPLIWKYYVDSEYKDVKLNGDYGWHKLFYDDKGKKKYPIIVGQPSQGNMWNVAQILRKDIPSLLPDIIKGVKK